MWVQATLQINSMYKNAEYKQVNTSHSSLQKNLDYNKNHIHILLGSMFTRCEIPPNSFSFIIPNPAYFSLHPLRKFLHVSRIGTTTC